MPPASLGDYFFLGNIGMLDVEIYLPHQTDRFNAADLLEEQEYMREFIHNNKQGINNTMGYNVYLIKINDTYVVNMPLAEIELLAMLLDE